MAGATRPVRLRPARAGDTEALSLVAYASFHAAFAPIMAPAGLATRSMDFFRRKFGRDWPAVTVALIGRRIAGFSLLRDRHVEMLFVDPKDQGSGVGLALLRRAETDGAATLECFAANEGARTFYERTGWRLSRSYQRAFAGTVYDFVLFAAPPPI
ncbi:MAG: GNAT family N-acetyltransferase [Proteobacteria bacterium]|nr:GNAT family N-acetyltransferase [Pseudomonadota bacterium]MBI3498107.1 GNAT family N-acetyltransferase [Pseudomonadota bacterium]